MLIRRAGLADIAPALAVMSEAFGLDMRAPTVHTVVADLLVAEEDGMVVGTAASIGFGATGWLGGITVAPPARGRGLGRELTVAAMDALGPRRTVLLLASELGRPIYDRLGFVPEDEYRVFMASVHGGGEFPETDGHALDRSVTGEDRSAALQWCSAVSCDGAVAFRPPWPALPIVGAADGAEQLLRGLVRPGMRIATPASNERAVSVMASLGTERSGVVRMRLGPPVAWRPTQVWGVFSLFFG